MAMKLQVKTQKSYNSNIVLHSISFNVLPGQIVSLLSAPMEQESTPLNISLQVSPHQMREKTFNNDRSQTSSPM